MFKVVSIKIYIGAIEKDLMARLYWRPQDLLTCLICELFAIMACILKISHHKSMEALLNCKFHISQISHRVKIGTNSSFLENVKFAHGQFC